MLLSSFFTELPIKNGPPSSSKIRASFAFPYIFRCRIQQNKLFHSQIGQIEVCLTQQYSKRCKKMQKCSYFATNRGAILYGPPCIVRSKFKLSNLLHEKQMFNFELSQFLCQLRQKFIHSSLFRKSLLRVPVQHNLGFSGFQILIFKRFTKQSMKYL